jgi:ABC-type uncharacterized transport system auxiliary subunit
MMRYAWLFVLPLVAAGCLTHKYVPVKQLLVEPQIQVGQAAQTEKSLGVRALEAGRPYRQQVVFRDKDLVLGTLRNTEWAEMPASVVTRALTDAIAATGHFKDVGNAGNVTAPTYLLTGELRRYDLDRTSSPWTAVVEVHIELRDFADPNFAWQATLTAATPLAADAPSALAAAMTEAVAEVVNKAANEIAKK